VLLVWVTVRGIRKDRAEGWLALPAVVLMSLTRYEPELSMLHVRIRFFPFGVGVSVVQIGTVLSLTIITVLQVRRFLHVQREREKWRLEIEQARQVQEMLIPAAIPEMPGLAIESEYRPARVVGGDFFQIIPHTADGSVLIVAGDVTGKGLQAGMLVAMIVGAIRNQAETSSDPLRVLQALNRRLCGRGEAHATCLALLIEDDGTATLSNAGHLPPYLNGKELPMGGALPLGMMESAEFSVMHFQLARKDRLMLMSDGIVEAQDERGQLFGFERIEAMLQKQVTAAAVATAAQNFGQQDDISVLSVTFTAERNVSVA
jgi:serine phosphatase RsbU (regulator of sigma subunit)